MKAPDPGVYPGVSFDEYATWEAANYSILRHFRQTPAHARWQMLHQEESSPFQALGHLVHFAVLETERFRAAGPVVAPKLDRRTTAGKAAWKKFETQNVGRQIVKADEREALDGILASIANHASAREALYGFGASELSIVWDEEVGDLVVRCKSRIDRLCEMGGFPIVLDVKTEGKPASTENFQRAVMTYGYHEQGAFYLRGLEHLVPPDPGVVRQFIWLVCETSPPYCVRLFQAEDAALQIGQEAVDKYLRTYAECTQNDFWPGWPEGIDTAGLPAWAYKRFDLE